jgi:M6 family metalloprotease-like protein
VPKIRLALSFALAASQSGLAYALPPPPSVVVKKGDGAAVNVKVRRIGELQVTDTPAPPPAVALTGTHKILVVLVETADSPWPSGYDKSRFEELLFAKSASSLREFYRENSYGVFDVQGQVVGPVRVSGKMNDFAFDMNSPNNSPVVKLVEAAARAASKDVKLSSFDGYDTRGRPGADGILDHLMVVYAEKTGAPTGFSPIWPHRGTTDIDVGSMRITSYTVLNHGAPLGVYVHEYGHDIGLPDLYDRDYSSHGAGDWCLMASGAWPEGGAKPSHIAAWGKIRLGWILPTIVAKSTQNLKVPSASEKPFALKIPIGSVDSREYFLVENRRRVGFDEKLPADGLVIWHIDESRDNNDDEKRKLMDVVEGAPVQDLDFIEQGRFPESDRDVYAQGKKDLFDDGSTPSAKTNSGEGSNIRVKVTSPAERVMSIDIDRPEIFNPGGVPFALEKDGYRYGRFAVVPIGKSSEALATFETTPGGYLVFSVQAFLVGSPNTKGSVTFKLYEDQKGAPGKELLARTVEIAIPPDGYLFHDQAMAGAKGLRLKPLQKIWLGITSEDGKTYPALNPFSVSKSARFRRKGDKKLVSSFNFQDGPQPVQDWVMRVGGFGYLEGFDRPEALATIDDEWVKKLKAADQIAESGKHDQALAQYEKVLEAMEKEPRKYEGWIASAVNAIGVEAYELKRYDLARERFEASLRRAQAARDSATEADILENLCETLFHGGDPIGARNYCDRSRRVNIALKRQDRLVENYYWLGRTHQAEKGGDPRAANDRFDQALKSAELAFASDPKELSEWKRRIERAKAGQPEDLDRVAERAEETKPKEDGPRERVKYKDLLQFLQEDTSSP